MASITKRGNAYLIRCYAGYTADGKQITKMMTWHPEAGMSEAKGQKRRSVRRSCLRIPLSLEPPTIRISSSSNTQKSS